ncbi:MAG: Uma2 family endonuclease [Candidatus Eremiobacterota bacterium]
MQSNLALNHRQEFTYGDYLTWPDDERWQIIDGIAYNMSPAPNLDHQFILSELHLQFGIYLRDKTCRIFTSPVDVVFPKQNEDIKDVKDVVQPDIIIVCDHKKIKNHKHCAGSPDLVIEILSPSTSKLDLKDKLKLYEREGVKEYWIVYPNDKIINVYKLEDNKYKFPEIYTAEDKIKVDIFPDLEIDLSLVFREYIQE